MPTRDFHSRERPGHERCPCPSCGCCCYFVNKETGVAACVGGCDTGDHDARRDDEES
jgi:hypothetical protein